MTRFALVFIALLACAVLDDSFAANCLVQGSRKTGDCQNVHVGPALPFVVKQSGHYSGNYADVTVLSGADASVSGNTDDVTVRRGARLRLSGNSGKVLVEGAAELTGISGWVSVTKGGRVVISGIAEGVSGSGSVVSKPGAIIGCVYVR
jgi:hypothetical protein